MQSGAAVTTDIQAQAIALEERLIHFAVRIVKLSANLPKTAAGRHIAGQILRSGTSPAPNYGEARGAESPNDFTHKLRVVVKELNETLIWLRMWPVLPGAYRWAAPLICINASALPKIAN